MQLIVSLHRKLQLCALQYGFPLVLRNAMVTLTRKKERERECEQIKLARSRKVIEGFDKATKGTTNMNTQ